VKVAVLTLHRDERGDFDDAAVAAFCEANDVLGCKHSRQTLRHKSRLLLREGTALPSNAHGWPISTIHRKPLDTRPPAPHVDFHCVKRHRRRPPSRHEAGTSPSVFG
jgi:hypothetical protein